MEIHLVPNSTTPIYKQIRNILQGKILSGELQRGFKLPSERALSLRLQIHRNTVKKAYELLIREGLIYASVKAPRGYFVSGNRAEHLSETEQANKRRPFSSLDRNFNYPFLDMQSTFERLYTSSYLSETISFAGVLLNKDALPLAFLHELMQEIGESSSEEPFWFCDPQGTERLRTALSDMLFRRNIYVRPQNIQITSETHEMLSNLARMYLKEGDTVAVEEPAFPAIVNILLQTGAQVLFVPMEKDGMSVSALKELAERRRPGLIYTMPNFHNPSSAVMSLEKRKQLLKIAQSLHIPIIEDDSLYDFNYSGQHLPSLYSMDNTGSVVYMDSFNLSFFPGARIGYLIAPDAVVKTYRQIINKDQLFLNSLSQYLLARFFEKGYYEKHRAFLTEFYRKKRDLMCSLLSEIPGISFTVPEGGLSVWVRLKNGINDRRVTYAAERAGVLVMPGNIFFAEGSRGESYLRLSFSSVSDEELRLGMTRFADVMKHAGMEA